MNADADFRPTATPETLQRRARLLRFVREFFDANGYWEVETPVLSRDVVVDAYLDPFVVEDEQYGDLFLQTSPEFGMKRLLASGAEAIYQITRAFRRGEAGDLHNPEFTICEWYRTGDTHVEQMTFTEELTRAVFNEFADMKLPEESFERIAWDDAFVRFLGKSVLHCECEELRAVAAEQGIAPPATLRVDDRDGWRNLLLTTCVEPRLGIDRPAFVYDYPASQSALARVRTHPHPVAERFELYMNGIEICNGYHELLDPDELRMRNSRQTETRAIEGSRPLPTNSRLLDAMDSGLPTCAGVALGLDRLAMLAFGLERIDQVIAFPFDRA